MARREHKESVGSRESVVQWFGGSEEVSTTKYRQRMSVTLQRALLSDLDKGTSFNGKDASAPRFLA